MEEFEIHEIDLDDLMSHMSKNVKKDIKDFNDLVSLSDALDREIFLADIGVGIGAGLDGFIRLWNRWDNEHNIPIEKRKPIKIYIDSYGGSLTDSFTIIDAIRMSKTPVWTIAIGCAYSGGFFSFIAGHKRFAYPHASFLFHEGATGSSGTSGQFENYTAFYKRQLEQLKNIILSCTNITEDEYKDIKREDIWYDVNDGIEKGFIDEIIKELI